MIKHLACTLAILVMALSVPVYTHPNGLTTKGPAGTLDANADLEIIRKRIIEDLLDPVIQENKVTTLLKSIRPDGSWPGINYQDTSRTGFEHRIHLENMLELSRAFRKPGSAFVGNPEVKKVISSALDFWISHDFICENWWWNEMGTPNLMINTLLIMDTDLTEKQRTEGARIAGRANLEASGARPGGDLIQIAGMLGKQGLFARNTAIFERVVKVMAEEIRVTTGRGLKPDLSFHHRVDNVISIHTYGTGYASSFAYWAVKIAGTSFTLPEEAMKLLIDYYLDGVCRSMAFGKYADLGARNRDLTRKGALAAAGVELPQNLLLASEYRKKELEEIVQIRKGEKQPALKGNRFFWHSEYFTHQRPSYFASVRMHSSRNHNMEQPHNDEGLKNHHFADGSNFITRTGKEYFNIFPVWDWQKIPGATIVQKPALPHWRELAKKGLTEFVGGVSDGEHGAAAFDFASPHDPLKARKSWFFFDREYVCLGAGVSSEAEYRVATTLNQCLLNKDVVIKTIKGKEKLDKGKHNLKAVSWVLHDSIAYIFPAPVDVSLNNSTARGNWHEINHQSWATEDAVEEDVFSLWLDHGTRPRNKGYAYIVVPGTGASAMDRYNKTGDIIILANTPEIQAVKHKRLHNIQIVFYKAGKMKISNSLSITAEQPCMVMVKTNGKAIVRMAVSDPTHKLNALNFEVNRRLNGSEINWRAMWNRDKKTSTIQVDMPGEGNSGKSVVLENGLEDNWQ
ncbi:MAG: polysaccharide lyase family 8 super-sandwich domain-containing protein [Chitinophagaceae bacterium]